MVQLRLGWLVVSSASLDELKAGDTFTVSAGRRRRDDRFSRILARLGVARYSEMDPPFVVAEVLKPAWSPSAGVNAKTPLVSGRRD